MSSMITYTQSQCSNLSRITCELDGYCTFTADSDCICGQVQWDQDIVFIFDSSMTWQQWAYSTQFASDLLYYGSPSFTTTRTAILQTANTSITSTLTLSFDEEPISNTIQFTLPDLRQTSQSHFYLQLSLQNALHLFTASSSAQSRKILIIFASQQFKQSPCKINMRSNEIATYIIAIGHFNKYPLTCVGSSEQNYQGLITSVTDAAQLSDFVPSMEAITCPHRPLIKITEIQLNGVNNGQYFEIYNFGHNITDLSQLQIYGIGHGNLTALLQLNQGNVAVVYNTDNRDLNQAAIPNCINCQCIESALTASIADMKWCDNAVYIGCCDMDIPNSCEPNNFPFENVANCAFDTGLAMISFTIGLIWTNPQTSIRQLVTKLIFNATQQWPAVADNYALELKNKGYNNMFGSSWTMSCDSGGTPGDHYLSNLCSFDCAVDGNALCNLNGGMNTAQCVGASCDCLAGFYAHYQTCLPLPTPTDCNAVAQSQTASNTTFSIAAWDADTTYLYFHCEEPTGCIGVYTYSETVTSLLTSIVFDQGRALNATLITLQAIGTSGNAWISQKTACKHVTRSPTPNPTQPPTYSIPAVPLCNISLSSDLKTFDILWQAISLQISDTAPPSNTFLGYVYYYNNQPRSTAACCTATSSPPNSVTFNLFSDFVAVSGHWDSALSGITVDDELLSATKCRMSTQNPTHSPTKAPTSRPTLKPSIQPTYAPTISPTLVELYVTACTATVLGSSTIVNMTWITAHFDSNTAPKTDTYYVVEWIYDTGKDNGYQEISAMQDTQKLIEIDDYLNVTLLQMHCKWSSFTQQGRKTHCDFFTVSPTFSPSIVPSKPPTPTPLRIPTTSPISVPSTSPTMAPTYIFDDVTWCNATFSGNTLVLEWGLLSVNDSAPSIPPANWIKYVGIIANYPSIEAEHIPQDISCDDIKQTNCWGRKTGEYEPSPVLFYANYTNNNGETVWRTNIINCRIATSEPTQSPNNVPTSFPSVSPSIGPVSVHLDKTACSEDRCGCHTNIESQCCLPACDWNEFPAPIIIVSEKDELNTTFYVRRSIQNYPFQILVEFNISAVTPQLADKYGFYSRLAVLESGNGINVSYEIPTDCYFTDWDDEECEYYIDDSVVVRYDCSAGKPRNDDKNACSWCDFYGETGPRCNDIVPNVGKFLIPFSDLVSADGGTFEESTFGLSILREGCDWGCDWKGEVFLLELNDCSVVSNGEDIFNCSLVYPSMAYIIVSDQDAITRQEYIKVPDSKYEEWLWYVILAGVFALASVSYVIFIWWRNKKIAEAHVAQTENDMEPVIDEQETFIYSNRM